MYGRHIYVFRGVWLMHIIVITGMVLMSILPMASFKVSMILLSFALFVFGTFERAFCAAAFTNPTCIEKEKEALLKFKHGLIDNSNLLSSWNGDDCCSWKGVQCSKRTGHVLKLDLRSPCVVSTYDDSGSFHLPVDLGNCSLTGQIDPSLIELQHLNYLDLSWNNFSYTKIPEFLGSISNLVYLNLSNALFTGKVPLHLGNLSSLKYLDLNNFNGYYYYGVGDLRVNNLEWVSGLPSLKHLDLSGVNLTNAKGWVQSISLLSSLQFLGLASCSLPKVDLTLQVNSTSLEFLDLSDNAFGPVIPNWLLNLTSIRRLNLHDIFEGAPSFPAEIINNNKRLASLDLSSNSIGGELPSNLSNLCHLFALRMNDNSFTGNISAVLDNPFSCLQNKLRYLDFGGNKISGPVPESLCRLNSLEHLDFGHNKLTGVIPESVALLTSLKDLYLGHNKLIGGIPESMGHMSNLIRLDLSGNRLKGLVSEIHLANLTRLTYLDISSNELAVELIDPTWVPPFQLHSIAMSDCRVGPQFPTWLRTQRNITYVYLSNASISGTIPDWFHEISFNIWSLDLSKNDLTRQIPGSLADGMPRVGYLYLGGNCLDGSIPISLCKMESLMYLDLSNNQLSGSLPHCWKRLSKLRGVNLENNQFRGQFPTSICSLKQLSVLGLQGNAFGGRIPKCLRNITYLYELDLSLNEFDGRIPSWIGQMALLSVLNLELNSFDGVIPTSICELTNLRVLILAHNHLSGSIPHCFGNLTSMSDPNSGVQYPGVFHFARAIGVEIHMRNITQAYTDSLGYLFSIDLSNNCLKGEIPRGLMELCNLQNLNLSHNNLSGQIPSEIAHLKKLESLDLSTNQFSGRVPQSLSELNFLSYFNLSFNQLSGPIPSGGGQLSTFKNDSYLGNDGLCGTPLSKSCSTDHDQPDNVPKHQTDDSAGEDESFARWLCVGIATGFATGFVGACGSLYFNHSWRWSFFLWSDKVLTQLLVMVEIKLRKVSQKWKMNPIG